MLKTVPDVFWSDNVLCMTIADTDQLDECTENRLVDKQVDKWVDSRWISMWIS